MKQTNQRFRKQEIVHTSDVGFSNTPLPASTKKDGGLICFTPSVPSCSFKHTTESIGEFFIFLSPVDSFSLSQISLKIFGGKPKWDY